MDHFFVEPLFWAWNYFPRKNRCLPKMVSQIWQKTCPKRWKAFSLFSTPTWRGRKFDRRLTATFLPGFSCWKSAKTFCNWKRPLAIGQFCFIHLLKISDGGLFLIWARMKSKIEKTQQHWVRLEYPPVVIRNLLLIELQNKISMKKPMWLPWMKGDKCIYVYSHKCRTNNHSSEVRDAWFHTRIIRRLAEDMSTWHHILNHERMPLPLAHYEIIMYHNVITSWNLNT